NGGCLRQRPELALRPYPPPPLASRRETPRLQPSVGQQTAHRRHQSRGGQSPAATHAQTARSRGDWTSRLRQALCALPFLLCTMTLTPWGIRTSLVLYCWRQLTTPL